MKHLTDEEYNNLYNTNEKFKKEHSNDKGNKKENKYLAGKDCHFYLQNPDYSEFSFITSGDDLATYNIAKKGLKYINFLNSKTTP